MPTRSFSAWAKLRTGPVELSRPRRAILPTLRSTNGTAHGAGLVAGRRYRRRRSLSACPRETLADDLAKDRTPDRLVGERRLGPPPAIVLHRLGGADETLRHRREVRVGVVEAEDQPAGSDPAQRQAFGAQVILQHPVVARRPRVADRPDRGQVFHMHRQVSVTQTSIQL